MSVFHHMGYMTVYQLVRTFQRLKTDAVRYANGCAFSNPPKGSSQDSNEAWANRWLAAYRRYDDVPREDPKHLGSWTPNGKRLCDCGATFNSDQDWTHHAQEAQWWKRMQYLFRELPFEIRHRWGGDAREMVQGIDAAISWEDKP